MSAECCTFCSVRASCHSGCGGPMRSHQSIEPTAHQRCRWVPPPRCALRRRRMHNVRFMSVSAPEIFAVKTAIFSSCSLLEAIEPIFLS